MDKEFKDAVSAMTQDFVARAVGNDSITAICGDLMAGESDGNVCLEVTPDDMEKLKASGIVSVAPDDSKIFVLNENRRLLYTRRYWRYEQNVRSRILQMAADDGEKLPVECPADGPFSELKDGQQEAIRIMGGHLLSVITGGPGTGKTYTIARAVKVIQTAFQQKGKELRLALAAPTGKAAARIKESMQREANKLGLDWEKIQPTTLHALLQPNYDFVSFKYNRDNPLPLDWLIVDEASMIDLRMMSKLLDALPAQCRLTLVGDAHQLSSVEAGRVFGDLCDMKNLQHCVGHLTQNQRLQDAPEIFRLAESINAGDADAALAQLKSGASARINYADTPEAWSRLKERIQRDFQNFSRQTTAAEAIQSLNDCRILCALRAGQCGCEHLNDVVQRCLGENTPIPMMITRKDEMLQVKNGDIGVVMPDHPEKLYLEPDGREIPLVLLPHCEPAFATTIHKSQGSEFARVIIVLPPEKTDANSAKLLTRELLYTAVTRTKGMISLYASDHAIRCCCTHKTDRRSGLSDHDAD